jgi:hypothetical protein
MLASRAHDDDATESILSIQNGKGVYYTLLQYDNNGIVKVSISRLVGKY